MRITSFTPESTHIRIEMNEAEAKVLLAGLFRLTDPSKRASNYASLNELEGELHGLLGNTADEVTERHGPMWLYAIEGDTNWGHPLVDAT
jgi:hypothetical protein